jgi:hypothetical protein
MAKPLPESNAAEEKSVIELRYGNICASIYRKKVTASTTYDVIISRNSVGSGVGQERHDFCYDDLMIVAKLMYDAHSYIAALYARKRAASAR